ncbi:Smr domain-containing protein [Bartonella sp. A1379B]|nr:Smr domain-containing protein [Bartonella sp. A1379B]AQX22354.1 Smr domain-containing protein [Bartonella sp. 11B]AQX24801.1 Smr domain-containing protein [Bartonella sp. Coyote22sub2]
MTKDERKKSTGFSRLFLWEQVCRTTVPLFQESQQKQKPTIVKEQKKKIIKAKKMQCFDHTVHRKIAKGLCRIEARIDLHGLIQDEAYRCLKEFLQSSHRWGLRYVLVITGKGHSHGSNGVLCQFVPYWLSTPVFQYYV